MGCAGSKQAAEQQKHNDAINKDLRKDQLKMQSVIKLLLLGAGESGKSTIYKQLKLIHLHGFTEEDRFAAKLAILNNIMTSIRALVTAANSMGLGLTSADSDTVMDPDFEVVREPYSPEVTLAIKRLWADPIIKAAYARRNEFQLFDGAAYFLDHVERVAAEDYVPTIEDILFSRVKTSGVTEVSFTVDDSQFRVVDVGGQRSERKKWMNCFDDVSAVLFVVALSEYDLTLYEDSTTNRMSESLKLFQDTVNNPAFVKTPFVLLLNKEDLFRQKLHAAGGTLSTFPDYNGGDDFTNASGYIRDKFINVAENPKKIVLSHVVCATETSSVAGAFTAIAKAVATE